MATKEQLYTYRNGEKILLRKETNTYVARALPNQLHNLGIKQDLEQVSSASTRVTINEEELDKQMDEVRKNVTAHHAYTLEDGSDFLITDRIIVSFHQAIKSEELSQFQAKYALINRRKYSEKDFLFQLTNDTGKNPVKLVVEISENEKDLIEICEHDLNFTITQSAVNIPTDPKYIQQWHLHQRLVDSEFDPRSSSNCEDAWNLLSNFGDANIVIGVTDDGCKIDHPDFNSSGKFASWAYMSGQNLIHRDSISANPANMYQQGSDHGTNCCGVVAAEVDAQLTVGAAPGCKLLPIKWESSDPSLFISDDKIYSVLEFIQDKVDVLSNSWGNSPHSNYSSLVVNKIKTLAQTGGHRGKGIVFLWAAGNENCPINFSGNINIPYDSGWKQRFDGSWFWAGVKTSKNFSHNLTAVPGVMYIAALSSKAQKSHYSNYGTSIALTAPSSNIHKYYRLQVPGLGITTSSGAAPLVSNEFGGTSSATPLVAGIAGLVISANPNLTALEVISILQKTASKDLNTSPYPKTPSASYDPNTSWDVSPAPPFDNGNFTNQNFKDGTWSPWFGFGKVDASMAVQEALRQSGGGSNTAKQIHKESSPGLNIPDNNTSGISDQITVYETGQLASIELEIDIDHTYIGDLKLSLISPANTQIDLHNRNGGSANNIKKKYTIDNTPALALLNQQSVNGNWILKVSDHAAIDNGILNSWKIKIGIKQQTVLEKTDTPGLRIPDRDPNGIERKINFTEQTTVKSVKVNLDITHTYIGDLIVNLTSPSGTQVNLHRRAGGTAENILKTFTETNLAQLSAFRGEQVSGDWKLNISDNAGQDIGKLNSWSLNIEANN